MSIAQPKYKEAVEAFEKCIENDENNNADPFYNKAMALYEL